jgi:hypothetical protein
MFYFEKVKRLKGIKKNYVPMCLKIELHPTS